MRARSTQCGVTLIELVLAIAIGAILLSGISNLLKIGLDAGASVRNSNELAYQGSFALARITDKARVTTPKILTTPAANTSGDWFAPVMYCLNAGNQLIETTTADTACTGTLVIAGNVSAFSATLPAVIGRPVAQFSLTMSNAGSTQALSSGIRLGGGVL
ncbi:MAG: prepilin-type N-terminal cleavage/methylation domain-containing protein [Gallionella sp.]|nr:prepilin-type N-terminal cleavage/methylation domain-containing protein [Gallionella sp.]